MFCRDNAGACGSVTRGFGKCKAGRSFRSCIWADADAQSLPLWIDHCALVDKSMWPPSRDCPRFGRPACAKEEERTAHVLFLRMIVSGRFLRMGGAQFKFKAETRDWMSAWPFPK